MCDGPADDGDRCVEGEKVGGEGNQKVISIGEDMASLGRYMNLGHLTSAKQNEEGVGEFVACDVEPHHGSGSPREKQDEPKYAAETECLKFGGSPILPDQCVCLE